MMEQTLEVLNNSGTILYPTDTILGLGCKADDVHAIEKLYTIKNRPTSKSFIILVASEAQLETVVEVPDLAWDILDLSEKPTTIIYDNPKGLPKELIANDNTIAIRLTKDKLCKQIIQKLKVPLVSTSANLSGHASPKILSEVHSKILSKVDYILPECEAFAPIHTASTIIKLRPNGEVKIIRE